MQSNKTELDNHIHADNPLYTAGEMAIVIEYKKQKRLRKGRQPDFICIALKNNELKDFIKLLKKNRSTIPDGTRFQFVYEFDGHWLSGDIRIQNSLFDFLFSIL